MDANFEIEAWNEEPFDQQSGGAKLTRASVNKKYAGAIEGSSVTEWVMAYNPDDSAEFVGIERIQGSLDGRRGTVVLRHVGTFAEGAATAELRIVSGTGALEGARGEGTMTADPKGRINLVLKTD
jgi:hypothetical protein